MSRCPLSISPSMEAPILLAAELLLQPLVVDDVPMLGELPVFDTPDIDGPQCEAPPGRRDAEQGLGVRCGEGHARDHLVPGDDPVLDPRLDVRHAAEDPAKILDLSGKTVRAAARVLDIRFGVDLREGAGIVGVSPGQRLRRRRHVRAARALNGACETRKPPCSPADSSPYWTRRRGPGAAEGARRRTRGVAVGGGGGGAGWERGGAETSSHSQ